MRPSTTASAARQRGVAVITAMLVVTIATVLAVELAWRTSLDLRRTEGLLSWEQAHQFGIGAETFGAEMLAETLQNQSGDQAVWSRSDDQQACGAFRELPLEGAGITGTVTGGVCELQGRFNLNNLVRTNGKRDELLMRQFHRLLTAIGEIDENADIDPATADIIAESVADWIDPDSTADFNGAEDDTYTSEQPPYRAANFWFVSVSELRAVRGVTAEIYAAILPYVAALPVANGQATPVNVNTASVPMLMSLGDDVTVDNALEWVQQSDEEPFTDTTAFAGFVDEAMFPYLDFDSQYFELRGIITIGTARLGMYSLLESNGQTVTPRLRQFGVVEALPVSTASATDDGERPDSDE